MILPDEARANLLDAAAFLAENIKSRDGYAAAMTEIVPLYLEKNAVDLAAQLSDSIEDPFARSRLLSRVAVKCSQIGDDDYAFQIVEAIEDARSQSETGELIAAVKAANGEFEKAFQIARTLEHPSEALAAAALELTKKNLTTEAAQTLSQIDYAPAKAHALQTIAEFYAQTGEKEKADDALEQAIAVAVEIDFAEEKIRILQNIAEHFIDAGASDKAIAAYNQSRVEAERLAGGSYRDVFLANAAQGFARAGNTKSADETLDSVEDKTQVAAGLLGFAREFWKRNETIEASETLEEAVAVLKSQSDARVRDWRAYFSLLAAIAAQFARFDKAERALEIAQAIENYNEQTAALSQIAQIAVLKNNDTSARQAIESIGDDAERMFALIGASDAKDSLRETRAANEFLDEAAQLAEIVPQLAARSQAFNELAKRFAERGEPEKARKTTLENLEIIAQIRDETTRAVALARLSEVYRQANFDLNDAEREVVEKILKRGDW